MNLMKMFIKYLSGLLLVGAGMLWFILLKTDTLTENIIHVAVGVSAIVL